jgi:hypothetical protein
MERRLLVEPVQVPEGDTFIEVHGAGGEIGPVHRPDRVDAGIEKRAFERTERVLQAGAIEAQVCACRRRGERRSA